MESLKTIKELRQERGWSRRVLAEKVGVTEGAIYFIETGRRRGKMETLFKIADVFGVGLADLGGKRN